MKKMIACLLVALLGINMAACSSGNDGGEKKLKIGIVQLVEHPALDKTYKGFVDGLKEAGYEDGKNIEIDYQNAQNEQANCQTIASKFVSKKSDLILAIATPAAQAAASSTKDIPILFSCVTDPASARLVASNEKPGGNVTGTSDLTPVADQIDLMHKVLPEAKKIGLLYCSNEVNSKFQIELAKKKAAELGLETQEATVSNSNELQQVTQSLASKVDAIYAPTDNMIAAGMPTVATIAQNAKVPVIPGEIAMLENGGLVTYGIDYYALGKLTAKQAVEILKDGKKPAEMPVQYLNNFDLRINDEVAKKLGITIPADIQQKAQQNTSSSK